MAEPEIVLPERVRRNFTELWDDPGWPDRLPGVVARLAAQWSFTVAGPGMPGGSQAYVAPVRRADGRPAVLKVALADEESAAEATALHHYAGEGAVALYEYDPGSGAMLMELASPGDSLVDRPDRLEAVSVASGVLRRLWRTVGPPPPGFPPIPRASELLAGWAEEVPARAAALGDGAPLGREIVDRAVALIAEYAVPDGPEGLANRDGHLGNVLAARRRPWLLIDPKPVLAERAFDAGFLIGRQLAERPDPEYARRVVARVADGLGVDRARAIGWALLRAVNTVQWTAAGGRGDTPFARGFAAATEVLAAL